MIDGFFYLASITIIITGIFICGYGYVWIKKFNDVEKNKEK